MTEPEKELVRFVSGYLDAGVSAEDYVKAFSQRLLDSIGRQSKPKVYEELEEEINRWMGSTDCFPEGVGISPLPKAMEIVERTACHFAQWGAEHLKK